jgi:voltage-gated potassium channel
MLIEGWSLLESLYMTIITLTTVGYGEIHPLSPLGQIFTICLIFLGVGMLVYCFGNITSFIVEGELKGILGRRRMERQIKRLRNHVIVCGIGRTGRHVIEEFIKTKTPFVAIEKDPEKPKRQMERVGSFLFVEGDATTPEALTEANIQNAKALATTLPSDKDNLFTILTAKELNPSLTIVTRLIEEQSRQKLRNAGADRVVSTDAIGGMRMASEIIRPATVSFLDTMLRDPEQVIRIEEAEIPKDSKLDGMTIKDAGIYDITKLLVIAVRRGDTKGYVFNPRGNFVLREGDILIVCGTIDQIEALRGHIKKTGIR